MTGKIPTRELRKLELAKAIASQPKLLIADEALAGLSTAEVDEILDLLFKLNDSGWDAGATLSAPGITTSTKPKVACATENFCVAVANANGGERYWTYNGTAWTFGSAAIPSRPVNDTTVSLTCTATNFCLSTSNTGRSRYGPANWSVSSGGSR